MSAEHRTRDNPNKNRYIEALTELGVTQDSLQGARGAVDFFFASPPRRLAMDPELYFQAVADASERATFSTGSSLQDFLGGDNNERS